MGRMKGVAVLSLARFGTVSPIVIDTGRIWDFRFDTRLTMQ
jgi:hypothetical protein